jgi:hypothetical protein
MLTEKETNRIEPLWRKYTRETCPDKWAFDWMTRPRADKEERLQQARQHRKKMLLDNPGKTLATLLPELPTEMLARMEADVRDHWDEIEV